MDDRANERPEELDWKLLPQEFHYLIDVTKAFAVHCGGDEEFCPTDEEIELLERTAKQIREKGGFEPILDAVVEHPEFHIIGQVLFLMERMGFQLS